MVEWVDSTNMIARIKNGTAIDHLPDNSFEEVIKYLNLTERRRKREIGMVSTGSGVESRKTGNKDIIKIYDYLFSAEEARYVTRRWPVATVSIIETNMEKDNIYPQGHEVTRITHKYRLKDGCFLDMRKESNE